MESKIKEVQDYFKTKILTGDFKVKETGRSTLAVEVDEKYPFEFLLGEFPAIQYNGSENFIMLGFTRKNDLNKVLMPIYNKFISEVLLKQKREELAMLESDLKKYKF